MTATLVLHDEDYTYPASELRLSVLLDLRDGDLLLEAGVGRVAPPFDRQLWNGLWSGGVEERQLNGDDGWCFFVDHATLLHPQVARPRRSPARRSEQAMRGSATPPVRLADAQTELVVQVTTAGSENEAEVRAFDLARGKDHMAWLEPFETYPNEVVVVTHKDIRAQ